MKRIFKKQIDNLLAKDKRTLKHIEVTYEGGKKVQFSSPEQVDWDKIMVHCTVIFKEACLEYAGFYEGDCGDEGPILVPRNKVKIRPRKVK